MMTMPLRKYFKMDNVLLAVLTGLAAFFRFYKLGEASLQIDNFLFWDILHRGVSAKQIFFDWLDLVGLTAQLSPLPAATKLFFDVFPLPLTFFTLILPFALIGTLTVPVAFMAGREFGGKRVGLMLAAFAAFNPLCVQMSREAYFYTPVLFGSFLALWAIGLSGRLLNGKNLPHRFYIIQTMAFLVLTWTSPSAWPFAFFFALYHMAVFGWHARYRRLGYAPIAIIAVVYLIIGIPLLLAPWGLHQIRQFTAEGHVRDYWTTVFAMSREDSQWSLIWPVFRSYAWGITPMRQIFSGLIVAAGVWAFCCRSREKVQYIAMSAIFLSVLCLNIIAVQKSVWSFGVQRIVPLVPIYFLILGDGLLLQYKYLSRQIAHIITAILLLAAGGFWTRALFLIPELNGLPVPYLEIARWADQNLPAGTPIITERYFTALHEFRVHAPEKVQFVALVPNQTPKEFNAFRSRDQILNFIDRYPNCGIYIDEHLWDRPEIGPFNEVLKHFSRSHTFTNNAAIELTKLGLYCRGGLMGLPTSLSGAGYAARQFYFNLPEDIVTEADNNNLDMLSLFGEGWRYLKPWQPMQGWPEPLMQALWIQAGMYAEGGKAVASLADLQKLPQQQAMQYLNQGRWADYRIPGARSPLRLFNLTEQEMPATLTVTAIALSGNVRCMIGDKMEVFPQALMTARRIPVTLKPGENQMIVALPMNQFMLVHDVRLSVPNAAD